MSGKILWNHDKSKPIGTITGSYIDEAYSGTVTYNFDHEFEKPKDKKMKKKELVHMVSERLKECKEQIESSEKIIKGYNYRISQLESSVYKSKINYFAYTFISTAFGIVGAIYLFLHIIGAL